MTDEVDHGARSHSDLPPSSSDKWLKCYAWRRLNAEFLVMHGQPKVGQAAEEGTRAHEVMERHLLGLQDVPLKFNGYDEMMEVIEYVDSLPGERHVETRIDFGARFGYEGLTGTLDIAAVSDTTLHIADLKWGMGLVEVDRNPQLMCYLSGAADRFGKKPDYALTIMQPRAFHKDGPIRTYRLTHQELQEFRDEELGPAIDGTYDPDAKATPGAHCRKFCNPAPTCKALRDLGRARLRMTPIRGSRDE